MAPGVFRAISSAGVCWGVSTLVRTGALLFFASTLAASALAQDESLRPRGPASQPALRRLPTEGAPQTAAGSPHGAHEPGAAGAGSGAAGGPQQNESATASTSGALGVAWQAWKNGHALQARTLANAEHRKPGATPAEQGEARRLLSEIADATLFAGRPVDNDTLTEWHSVRSGEVLAKIARKAKLQTATLVYVNRMGDPAGLQVGQRLLVPQGPFTAVVDKSDFRMDLYLRDQYVRSYPVGLGSNDGTPTGVWRVKTTLANPTYYPPESAPDRRVIGPNDPKNPLGEYWIGLEGIEGEAVGKKGFGIHGTIEPESIGRNASLGCIRMHNDDVAVVFKLLVENASTVTVVP